MAVGGMTVGDLVAYLKVDDDDFNKKTDAAEGRFGKLGGVLKTAGVAAGAAAFAGLGAILHTGMQESMDASAAQAQLEAGIKSTGGAAGVTIGYLNDLASSIQSYSGQTDDSIAQTEALLLTFTNIKNSGPDKIFDAATKAAADMAARMGTDAPSAAIQLGKALNDPVKGVTALTRVGVSFTEAQKAEIAALTEAGDVAGAQKIVLAELAKEFGGAAKAAGDSLPGKVERGKRAFEDMSQNLVGSLMPTLVGVMEVATKVMQAFDGLPGPVKAVVLGFVGLAAAAAMLAPFATAIAGIVGVMKGWAIATKVQAAVQWVLNAAMSANPIGLVVIAIAALVAAFVIAYKKSETFRAIVTGAWEAIKKAAVAVFNFLASFFKAWVGRVRSALSGIAAVVSAVVGFFGRLKTGAVSAFNAVVDFVRGVPGKIKSAVGNLGSLLYGAGKAIITGLWNGIKDKFEDVKDFVRGIGSWIGDHKGPLDADRRLLVPHGGALMAGLEAGIMGGLPSLQRTLAGVSRGITVAAVPQVAFAAPGVAPARAAAPGATYVFEGCLFAQDFDDVVYSANKRGEAKIIRRDVRTSGGVW